MPHDASEVGGGDFCHSSSDTEAGVQEVSASDGPANVKSVRAASDPMSTFLNICCLFLHFISGTKPTNGYIFMH